MFINPQELSQNALHGVIESWIVKQFSESDMPARLDDKIQKAKKMILSKQLVICYSSNDELPDNERIDIKPVESFNLSPNQVTFS